MDCNSARLFIPFHRPGGRDLDGPEAAELDAHLDHCTECNALAMNVHRLDQHLGQAMRAVEVPRGLRDQILERLASQPAGVSRRWVGPAVRVFAVAAALLLLVGAWFVFYNPPRQPLSVDDIVVHINISRPTQEEGNAQLRQLGTRPGAPAFVNYAFLSGSPSLAILPGTQDLKSPVKVPQFVFSQGDRQAIVYAISRRSFQLQASQGSSDGYTYRADVVQPEQAEFAYLVLYNGPNWDWLRVAGEID